MFLFLENLIFENINIDKNHTVKYNIFMNDYELSKIADLLDEDALRPDELDLSELLKRKKSNASAFKEKYLEFYDDIKTTPRDDW